MRIVVAAFLLGLWNAPLTALAQTGVDPGEILSAMVDAYGRLDYATAEQRAREALNAFESLSADQLVQVHTTLGLIFHARSEPLEARDQFVAALSLAPTLSLDPVLVSPKTMAFFEEIKAEVGESAALDREAAIRYVQVYDPRPAATLRSMAVPGWGQLYKGERRKGWALFGTWAALAGGTIAAHAMRGQARQDYIAEDDPAEVEARYATYNAWNRVRGGLALGTLAVWSFATLDALVHDEPRPNHRVVWVPVASQGELGVRLQIRLSR